MATTLSEATSASIREAIDNVTADKNKVPGLVAVVVDKNGKVTFSHASGTRGKETQEPMTLDSTFWIASCTKLIGGIAAMQLCEQGRLALNDADIIERVAPELKRVRILNSIAKNGKAEYIDKKNRITLKMLLTHTAGFGYTFYNDKLRQWSHDTFNDEVDALPDGILGQPLVFEPGTQWHYGVGIDWAGTIVERVSGMSLNDYFQENIFTPLGIQNISMFPSQSMKDNLAYMHQRDANGNISQRNHLYRTPLTVSDEGISQLYNSAGAGCYARPVEYCGMP